LTLVRGMLVNSDPIATHLAQSRYGSFTLTDAVRPGLSVPIVPREGYRLELHRDEASGLCIPMLTAAVSRERLFDVFLDLLTPLSDVVDVVLETSHARRSDSHRDLRRTDIDKPVLASHFCDFESLLLDDGCTGVAVLSPRRRMEVQFDEHKLLIVYARNLTPFRRILRAYGIRRVKGIEFLPESEHMHSTTRAHAENFRNLCWRLGVADLDKVLSDDHWNY